MKLKDYKELEVWQRGIEICDRVYDATEQFPKREVYGLSDQMRRAAVSIASNIAEGARRQYTKEFVQHLYVSLGSCAELETQMVIAERRGYVSEKVSNALGEELSVEQGKIMALIKSLKNRLQANGG
jgi:four helix bundle protein